MLIVLDGSHFFGGGEAFAQDSLVKVVPFWEMSVSVCANPGSLLRYGARIRLGFDHGVLHELQSEICMWR